MMKRLFAVALLLSAIAAVPARAQYTTVSGTVTDPEGIPYTGATIKAQLSTPGATLTINDAAKCKSAGQGSAPCHVPIQGTYPGPTLDSTGSFTMILPDNSDILPASPASQYLFTLVLSPGVLPPFGTGPQVITATITISGASQNIGSTLSGLAPALTNTIPGSGNVVAGGTLANGNLVCGAGSKNVADCGVALSAVALLASPNFTGTPTAPTPAVGTNTTQIATMAALQSARAAQLQTADMTPLTVTGTTATQINLKTSTFPAGSLNSVGKTFRVWASGAGSPNAAQGNVCPNITFITITNPSATPCNLPVTTAGVWTFSATCTVLVAGATGTMQCAITFGVAPGPAANLAIQNDRPFQWGGGFGTLDLTAAQTMQFGWTWATGNAANSVVEDTLYVQFLN